MTSLPRLQIVVSIDVLTWSYIKDPDASFLVISDHGMTPVQNHYDLVQKLEERDLHMPQDYLTVYDSTMVHFWFFNVRARQDIFDSLKNVTFGGLLSDSELRQLGVYFSDHRYGETVFLLDSGWLISGGDFNEPGWKPCGMHGHHPNDPHSDAICFSTTWKKSKNFSRTGARRWKSGGSAATSLLPSRCERK